MQCYQPGRGSLTAAKTFIDLSSFLRPSALRSLAYTGWVHNPHSALLASSLSGLGPVCLVTAEKMAPVCRQTYVTIDERLCNRGIPLSPMLQEYRLIGSDYDHGKKSWLAYLLHSSSITIFCISRAAIGDKCRNPSVLRIIFPNV